jgi:hypothetical protein
MHQVVPPISIDSARETSNPPRSGPAAAA